MSQFNQLQYYAVQFAFPKSDYWNAHSSHDDAEQAIKIKNVCEKDERKRGIETRWRIIKWTGQIIVDPSP